MHPGLLLSVDGLACYRATRLAVKDHFPPLAGPRRWIERRTTGTRLEALGDLVTCHFCASGWIALGLTVRRARELRTLGIDPLSYWLAVWAVGAGLAHLEPEK